MLGLVLESVLLGVRCVASKGCGSETGNSYVQRRRSSVTLLNLKVNYLDLGIPCAQRVLSWFLWSIAAVSGRWLDTLAQNGFASVRRWCAAT